MRRRDDETATGLEHATAFNEELSRIGNVFEYLKSDHRVDAGAPQRQTQATTPEVWGGHLIAPPITLQADVCVRVRQEYLLVWTLSTTDIEQQAAHVTARRRGDILARDTVDEPADRKRRLSDLAAHL